MTPDHLRKELGLSVMRVRDGFILAFLATFLSIPQIWSQSPWLYEKISGKTGTPLQIDQFRMAELFVLLSALLIIILVGNLANRRAGLEPFKWPGHKKIWASVAIGILFIPAGYLLFDHFLLALQPQIFPEQLKFALVYPVSLTFADELFVRFGFLALFAWTLKRFTGGRLMANILVSAVFALFSFYDQTRFLDLPLKAAEISLFLLGNFAENMIAGALYFKHGFWSSLAFRIGAGLKFPLYFLLFF